MKTQDEIRLRFLAVCDHMDERTLRLFVASEARAFGVGGIATVSKATGFAKSAIGRGLKDLDQLTPPSKRGRQTKRVRTSQAC